jgi:hypothetical protein
VSEMARQLRRASSEPVAAHEGLVRMIRSWEDGTHAISERYELLYLRVFPEVNGTELRALAGEVRKRAEALPGPGQITAMEAAALRRARDDETTEAVKTAAADALSAVRLAHVLMSRLAALMGDGDE